MDMENMENMENMDKCVVCINYFDEKSMPGIFVLMLTCEM